MDLRPYICNQCGGPINVAKMRCEHCGTEYYDKSLRHITISTVRPGEATISAEVRQQRLKLENELVAAKTKALANAEESKVLYEEALKAMRRYR